MDRIIWAFDSVVLAAVVPDLEPLVGWRVHRIVQPGEHELLLRLRAGGQTAGILCSVHPRWARLHLAEDAPRAPAGSDAAAGPFAQMLRRRLEHARLASVHQIPFERVLTVRFETDVGPAELVAEIMGRHSNLILVQDGIIAGALKPITPSQSSIRPVQPGLRYQAPPAGRPSPADVTHHQLHDGLAASAEPLAKHLVATLIGISPTMAREIATRAALDPDTPAREAAPHTDAVAAALRALAQAVERREFAPVIYLDGDAPCGYAPFPLHHITGLTALPVARMSDAVARVAVRLGGASAVEEMRAPLLAAINAAVKKVNRAEEDVRRNLDEAAASDVARQHGELLLAYATQITPGASEATVPGFDGAPVRIALDPTRTPVENAQALFDRYTRIRRALPALQNRLRQLDAERAYLDSALTMVEHAGHPADLQELRRELADEGYLRRPARRAPPPAPHPRTYALPGGATILVGRTNQENDRLTFKVAAADDLWFHARGVPGAHVVLRTGGRQAREDDITRAAAAAAYFSRARGSGSVPVDCTQRRYVRKPKGARPGAVVYDHARTVFVAPALPAEG